MMGLQMGGLRDEILRRWGQYGEWDAAGVDRAQELADLLIQNGISSLDFTRAQDTSNQEWIDYLRQVQPERAAAGLANLYNYSFGGKTLGFLGDVNNDGSFGKIGSSPQEDNLIGWSARGKGNVGFRVGTAPDGSLFIAPNWSSSSDMDEIRDIAKGVAFIGGSAVAIPALAGMAGGGAPAAATAGGTTGGSGLTLSGAASNAGIGAGTTTGFGGTGAGLSIPASVPGTATSLGTTGLGITGTTGAGLMGATPAGNSTLQSPLTNSPQFQPSPNLPTGAVDPVTMPSLPSSPTINPMPGGVPWQEAALGTLPEVAPQQSDIPATDTPAPVNAPSVPGSVPGPGPGPNSPLPSWMPQWMRDNPQLARQVVTGLGGLFGAMEGNSGGSAPAAPSYGPAQQWSSGLSMAAQPRPRQQQPALNYNQPAPTGLAMGAGRFLRGG